MPDTNKMQFVQLTQANYDKLVAGTLDGYTLNNYTLYFISDKKRIYKGGELYSNEISVGNYTEDGLKSDSTVVQNRLYVDKTSKSIYIYAGNDAQTGEKIISQIGVSSSTGQDVSDLKTWKGTSVANKIVTTNADGNLQYSNAIVTTIGATGGDTNIPTQKAVRTQLSSVQSAASSYVDSVIGGLDVSQVGGVGKVVTTISETDGKIAATAIDLTAANVSVASFSSATVQGALDELAAAIEESTDAQKTYSLNALDAEAIAALGDSNVKQAYQLVDEDGAVAGDVVKIYKDSSLKQVYLGDSNDTVATDGTVTKNTVTDAQSLNFVYQLANGSYQLIALDVTKFLTQSQFDSAKGLGVNGGVVSVKLGASNEYVKFDSNGNIVDTGINQAIATAKAQAIASASSYTDSTVGALESRHSASLSSLANGLNTINGDANTAGSIAHAVAAQAAIARAAQSANAASIATLNGNSEVEGSVDYKIAEALQWVVIAD